MFILLKKTSRLQIQSSTQITSLVTTKHPTDISPPSPLPLVISIIPPQPISLTIDPFTLLDELVLVLKAEINKRLKINNTAKTFTIKIPFWMGWFIIYNDIHKPITTYITRSDKVSIGHNNREAFSPVLVAQWWEQHYDEHTAADCADTNDPPKCLTHKTTMEIMPQLTVSFKQNVLVVAGKVRRIPPGGLRYVDTDLQ